MTPEKRVQTKIINFLVDQIKQGKPVVYERRQAGGFSYKAGRPDLWFTYDGLHVEVEVKAPGGEPSPLQVTNEEIMRRAGILYWRGDSFADFTNFYQKIDLANHQ